MCGLAGGFWKQPPPGLQDRLEEAAHRLRLRGPNDRGVISYAAAGGAIALVHSRLSIIDLTAGGHQPMRTADERFTMLFNGEIYNYLELREKLEKLGATFASASDSEVLLQAWSTWGEGCVTRLDGMFAFAIHDRQTDTITCCRDGFGIKPLFYSVADGRLLFASTQSALAALRDGPPRANWQRCYDYLVHGDYDSSPESFVDGASHLPPGHLLRFDLAAGKLTQLVQWWAAPTEQREGLSFAQSTEQFRELFLRSVRRQLRSDVPIGAALSGGLDSSAVVCAMRALEPSMDIDTFTYAATGSPLNEDSWANLINKHVGARAHRVEASAADLLADLDDMLRAQEEPFGSTSIYAQYCVFRLARERGVTVTLDGQGADELLAGYSGYPGQRLLSILESEGIGAAHHFARNWAAWPGRSYRLALMELGRVTLPDSLYGFARRHMGRDFRPSWLDIPALAGMGVRFTESRAPRSSELAGRRVIEQLSHSLQRRGLPALLRHADRNSMRFSVESRVPFLNNDMAEFLLSLPENLLISANGETKSVMRAGLRGIVPDVVLDRRDKIGFATPEAQWLKTIAPQLRQRLEADLPEVPFLKDRQLLEQFNAVIEGKLAFTGQVWRWFNFVRWYRAAAIQS